MDYAEYKGRKEGQSEAKVNVVLKGALKGIDIEILTEITGFTRECVEEILEAAGDEKS